MNSRFAMTASTFWTPPYFNSLLFGGPTIKVSKTFWIHNNIIFLSKRIFNRCEELCKQDRKIQKIKNLFANSQKINKKMNIKKKIVLYFLSRHVIMLIYFLNNKISKGDYRSFTSFLIFLPAFPNFSSKFSMVFEGICKHLRILYGTLGTSFQLERYEPF